MILFGEKYATALEMLLKAELAWGVESQKLVTESGIETDHIAVVRDDTNKVLGVHKNSYEIFNNQQMAELLFELSNHTSLPVHSAGALNGGRKVYIQLKAEDLNLGSDQVRGFLTAVNSFDGSASLAFGLSTVTVSCSNTFYGAYRQLASKVRHTKNMQIKIEDLLKSVEIFRSEQTDHFDIIKRLASAPATKEALEMIYKAMFNVSMADVLKGSDNISTRTKNNITRFNEALALETADKGQTLWGQFSGVTRYSTHMVKKNADAKMFGAVARKDRKIFNQFGELVN